MIGIGRPLLIFTSLTLSNFELMLLAAVLPFQIAYHVGQHMRNEILLAAVGASGLSLTNHPGLW